MTLPQVKPGCKYIFNWPLKVCTYNIAFCGESSLAEVAAVISSINADIVMLNEIDDNADRSGNVDQPALLAAASGYSNYLYAASTEFLTGSTGNAIFSHNPISSYETLMLTLLTGNQRNALLVKIKTSRGTMVLVSTHLDGGDTEVRNNERIFHINEIMTAIGSDQAVIGGDFNHTPDRASHLYALTILDNAGPDDSVLSGPDRRDFIYLKGRSAQNAQIIESAASDHYPLVATVT